MLNLKKLSELLRTLNSTRLLMMNMVYLSCTNTILGGQVKRTGPLASSLTPLSTRSLTILIGISTLNISRLLYMISMTLLQYTDLILTIITMDPSTSELDLISSWQIFCLKGNMFMTFTVSAWLQQSLEITFLLASIPCLLESGSWESLIHPSSKNIDISS